MASIPLAFLVAVVVGWIMAIPLTAVAILGSAVGLLAMVDALFLNPPREPISGPPPA